jgi:hypothetical protein
MKVEVKQTSEEKTTFQQFRLEANLSLNGLSRAADVDYKTARRAERGLRVPPLKARALLKVLSRALGREIDEEDILEWRECGNTNIVEMVRPDVGQARRAM